MKIDVNVSTALSQSARAKQLSAMFDVPLQDKVTLSWSGELPVEAREWSVGAILGPSGSGKTLVLRQLFGEPASFDWSAPSVIDDFRKDIPTKEVAAACQAVGFNTIPAWLRPFRVLSNGEAFRVDLARRLLETPDPIVVDEFTSVVDRQVAQIGAFAVQKYIRKSPEKKHFVAASCHYDIIDWLQPDWIFEPATMTFSWRSLRRRPPLEVEIERVPRTAWRLFAPFHYLTRELNPTARCFVLFVGQRPAAFNAYLHRPHARVNDIIGSSRLVTLPDWQGLGLGPALCDCVSSAYAAIGKRVHSYPAHPALTRVRANSPNWRMIKAPGTFATRSKGGGKPGQTVLPGVFGGRPNATFEYCGPKMPLDEARSLLGVAS